LGYVLIAKLEGATTGWNIQLYSRRLQKKEYHWKNTYNFFSMDTTSSTNASKPQQSTRT
jgi:hypothetical protein